MSQPPSDPANVPLPASRDSLAGEDHRTSFINGGGLSGLTLDPPQESQEEFQSSHQPSQGHVDEPPIGGGEGGQGGYGEDDEVAAQEGHDGETYTGDPDERIRQLEDELDRTRGEKETFEAQYRSLLGKLTTMRNTLGDKLKQDADELDRRELEINTLREQNDDFSLTIETLKSELIQTNEDSERVHSELEQLRLRAFDSEKQTSEEATSREMALRELQEDVERLRLEREEWEGEAMRERVRREELVTRVSQLEMELAGAKSEREVMREERDREAESASNLHLVLEEFQTAKERDIKSTLGDIQIQLQASNEALAEFKQRASEAEERLTSAGNDSEKLLSLAKELETKNAVIGKLRHDAVIMNEHLTEALRRLKKDSNENSVDRRLVSNVLITFLNTPRADTKRFEMLQLLSSILSWSDDQREQVGLQKSSGISKAGAALTARLRGKSHARSGNGPTSGDGLAENETFSQLWVEFLIRESQGQAGSANPSGTTSPGSPPPGTAPSDDALSTRFDFSSLPPILSPPLLDPDSSRRPSLARYQSPPPNSGSSTAPSSIAEEKR